MWQLVKSFFDKLVFKISLLILGLILLVVGVMTYSSLNRENNILVTLSQRTVKLQKETHEQSMRARGRSLGQLMKDAAQDALLSLDYGSLNSLADNAVRDPEVNYVLFLDDKNQVVANAGDYPFLADDLSVMQQPADTVSQQVDQKIGELDKKEFFEEIYQQKEKEYLEVASPIRAGGARKGLVRIGFSLQKMKNSIQKIEETNQAFISQRLRESIWANLLIAGISLLGGLLAAILLARRISRPVVNLMGRMKQAESGDLTTRVEVNSRDEIGQLGESFNNMMQNLRKIVGEILESSSNLRKSASELASVVSQNQASIETVSENMETIEQGARENAELVDESTQWVGALTDRAEEITDDNRRVMDKSEQMRRGAGEGQQAVDAVVDNMEAIDAKVTRTRRALEKLQKAAGNIDKISDSIEFITRKTNLLAYNVSISAAEAGGDQAEEISSIVRQVQNLARESSTAANRIKRNVTSIKEAGDEVAERMEATDKQTDEGVQLARQAGQRLKSIVASVNRVYEHFTRVTELAEEQAEKTNQINQVMTRISHISSQTKERTGDITVAVDEQAQGIENVSRAAENLNLQADNLRELMEGFEV